MDVAMGGGVVLGGEDGQGVASLSPEIVGAIGFVICMIEAASFCFHSGVWFVPVCCDAVHAEGIHDVQFQTLRLLQRI
jgi:hypothetical protein